MLIDTIILAIIQALTEFIPVSSSGHLLASQEVFGFESSLGLDVALHFGTLIAMVVFFWGTLWQICKDAFMNRSFALAIKLIIATIPAVVAGFLFSDFFEEDVRRLGLVAIMLASVGLAMILVDRYQKGKKNVDDVTNEMAFITGLAQVVALIPGTSRSGITILAGRMQGMSNAAAAEFAFLMGIPVIFGATLKVMFEEDSRQYISDNSIETLIGVFVAAVVGYLAIKFMIGYLKNHGLSIFGYYRIGLSLVLLVVMLVNG